MPLLIVVLFVVLGIVIYVYKSNNDKNNMD